MNYFMKLGFSLVLFKSQFILGETSLRGSATAIYRWISKSQTLYDYWKYTLDTINRTIHSTPWKPFVMIAPQIKFNRMVLEPLARLV